jgi:cyclohexyl-isocyanide hydratase
MIPHDTHSHIGSLLFEGIDQIDLPGRWRCCRVSQCGLSPMRPIPNAAYPQRNLPHLRQDSSAGLAT